MCGITVCFLVIAFMAIPAGRIGDIYPRIITPRQHSLVIGTSRAAQSVNPLILNECLEELYTPDLYNFAFHLDISSYNPYYVEAIRKKLLPYDGQKHYFILAVDPWSFDDGGCFASRAIVALGKFTPQPGIHRKKLYTELVYAIPYIFIRKPVRANRSLLRT